MKHCLHTARVGLGATLFACALCALPVYAQALIPVHEVTLQADAPVILKGRLRGPERATRDFVVHVAQGATLSVSLQASNANSTHFNILPPDGAVALFVGEMDGSKQWQQKVAKSGNYTVRVYLNRAVARRGGKSDYTLTLNSF